MDARNSVIRGDGQLIDLFQDHEVTYWTYELNCSSEELMKAVNEVGPSIKEIRVYLEKAHAPVSTR